MSANLQPSGGSECMKSFLGTRVDSSFWAGAVAMKRVFEKILDLRIAVEDLASW